MGGIISQMEKLNTQINAIVSDAEYLDSRFARTQNETNRLTKMQDLIFKVWERE